ncbi:MAG: thiamine pyrophosphate-binding protein [Candidatus Caldarchaeum sp.]
MKVADVVADIMVREGAKWLFGLAGSTIVRLLSYSSAANIEFVMGLNENVSVGMADGYSRYTGSPAFIALHTAPGLSTALPNLYNAYVDGSPLVIYLGDVDSRHELNEPGLWLEDMLGVVTHYTKWCWKAVNPSDVPTAFRRAIKVSTSPNDPGPTCVIVPENIEDAEISYEPSDPTSYRINKYLKPNQDFIALCVSQLINAQRPVVIAGRQVAQYDAVHLLVELCEELCLPVASESPFPFTHSVNFPHDHELYVGLFDPEHPFIKTADVVLAIGCRVFTERTFGNTSHLPKHSRLIHIHTSPWEIARVYPVSVGIVADPKSALETLLNEIRSIGRSQELSKSARLLTVKRYKEFVESVKNTIRRKEGTGNVRTWKLVEEMDRILPKDTVIVDEGVVSSTYLSAFYTFSKTNTLLGRSPGCLGWGVAASLGVKLAAKDRPVVCFTGDGAFMFTPQSLWTATKYHLPVIIIICNNRSYISVKMSFDTLSKDFGKYVGTDLDPPIDYAKLGESMGASTIIVEKEYEIAPALKSALESDKPVLVDVRTEPMDRGFKLDFKNINLNG